MRSQEDSSLASQIPVAVLMSVYSGDDPQLFERAMRSVLDQTYSDGPINVYLCVDGPVSGATDTVIEHFQSRVHRIVRNDAGIGLAKSLNRLIGILGKESLIFRMDSDDYSVPERFSLQATAMRRDPGIDILGGGIAEVEKCGEVIREVRYPAEAGRIRKQIAARNPVAHPTVCFRRSAISTLGSYPETSINQDWALWFEALRLGLNISNLDHTLVHMTVSDTFFSRRGASRAAEEFGITFRGILKLHGLTWRLLYPCMRFVFRLAPARFRRAAYNSRLR